MPPRGAWIIGVISQIPPTLSQLAPPGRILPGQVTRGTPVCGLRFFGALLSSVSTAVVSHQPSALGRGGLGIHSDRC
ncbi:hypothetical protein VUR80DRAFT_922 [Thermomyces stellatus]